ncbi:hypothetical protein OG455_04295 [Kitasatospora sp. NBC_01287]|uniref:universal stress protein n=1 Tax=Kitasatospora sp. NBC_01287 TaxID=2903573 RepID=UPI002254D84C|nr:universal stress protein [Kitasatospora sp. NBC_01287]MCX4744746.1 hypothetical protein [Kitasatospora sp. NBC_01287]
MGIDGSECSAAAAFAFQDAALRHTDLPAVEVRAPREVGTPDFEEESLLALSRTLAGWRERYPDVSVRQEVRMGHPAAELALAAAHAQCLVVGSEAVAGRHETYPDVDLTHEVIRGHPVEELAKACEHALAVVPVGRGDA